MSLRMNHMVKYVWLGKNDILFHLFQGRHGDLGTKIGEISDPNHQNDPLRKFHRKMLSISDPTVASKKLGHGMDLFL